MIQTENTNDLFVVLSPEEAAESSGAGYYKEYDYKYYHKYYGKKYYYKYYGKKYYGKKYYYKYC
jgi:hypothetical protein